LFQPVRGLGYRFAIDSVLLGYFASKRSYNSVADLGAGCGVVGFILLWAKKVKKAVFVEKDKYLIEACRRGVEINGFSDIAEVVEADLRERLPGDIGKFDLVVSNPPYRRKGLGRVSESNAVAVAKHELEMSIGDLLQRVSEIILPGGRFCAIFPSFRVEEVLKETAKRGIKPVCLRFVHSLIDRPANAFLGEFKSGTKRNTVTEILPPLIIHERDGSYTEEVACLLDGNLLRG